VPYRNLGAAGTQPNAISASGVITGIFVDSNQGEHGFLRSRATLRPPIPADAR
jgi:hypothetical protein